jgi:hypothetical protein
MKRLHVFGDSFTDANIVSNNKSYLKWKGYTPKTFHEIVSEKLNLEVINYAKSFGMDNYTIFQHICDNVNDLDGSIVVINWSEPIRFRMVDTSTQKWKTIIPESVMRLNKGLPYVNGVINETIDDVFVNRENQLWLTEVSSWINLINKALQNSVVIHWSWYNNKDRETITEETNGDVIDFHYSEKGHAQLAEWIIKQIENGGSLKSPFAGTSIL